MPSWRGRHGSLHPMQADGVVPEDDGYTVVAEAPDAGDEGIEALEHVIKNAVSISHPH